MVVAQLAEQLLLTPEVYSLNPFISKLLKPSFSDCTKLQQLCASFTDGFEFFLEAIAKAKKLIYSTESQASFTGKEVF